MDDATRLVRAGRPHRDAPQPVNPPVARASTVLFPDLATMRDYRARRATGERLFSYGARGTPSSMALEDALCALEGGDRAFLYPSGLAALGAVLLAYTQPGDHVAIIDTSYPPLRRLAETYFTPRGVTFDFFRPDPSALEAVMRPETRLVMAESPGSNSFEVIDMPEMARIAHAGNALIAVDNTWAAGVFHKPLLMGADISVQAATKYICGHSDVMMGAVVVREPVYRPLFDLNGDFGFCVSPDDAYSALRGLRTLTARLDAHERNGLEVARWLDDREEVSAVLHPAFESCPGHALWVRDFSGSSGLFAFRLKGVHALRADAFVDRLSLFGIGASWGGFESLALPVGVPSPPADEPSAAPTQLVRLHIGLESPADLIADLEAAFDAAVED